MPGSTPVLAMDNGRNILASPVTLRPRAGDLMRAIRLFRRNRTGVMGLVIIVVFITVAILAAWLAPYDPLKIDLSQRFIAPGQAHLFGTDNLGRDILSRVIVGSRISLWVGLVTVGLSMLIGVPLGLLAGYLRGAVDGVIMRIVDMFLAFPVIILAIAIVAVRGPGLTNVMLALAFVYWTTYARVTRGVTLVLREEDYILAARSIGISPLRIMARHILPNAVAPILVIASLGLGNAILAEASLSFLGLGIQPPQASWGSMLNFGMQFLRDAPYLSTFPGIAIFFTVLGFNLLGDGLRDALDPRLRG
jgi:peptide/nickel transport system permease protein